MELLDLFQILDIFPEAAEEFLEEVLHQQAAVRHLVGQMLQIILAVAAVEKISTKEMLQPAVLE